LRWLKKLINTRVAHSLAVEVETDNGSDNNRHNQENKKGKNQPEEPTERGGVKRVDGVVGGTIESGGVRSLTDGAGDKLGGVSTIVIVAIVLVIQVITATVFQDSDVACAGVIEATEDDGTIDRAIVLEGQVLHMHTQSFIGGNVDGATKVRSHVLNEVVVLHRVSIDPRDIEASTILGRVGSKGVVVSRDVYISLDEDGTTIELTSVGASDVGFEDFKSSKSIAIVSQMEETTVSSGDRASGSDVLQSPLTTREDDAGAHEDRINKTSRAVARNVDRERTSVIQSDIGDVDLFGRDSSRNGIGRTVVEDGSGNLEGIHSSDVETSNGGGDLGVEHLQRTISGVGYSHRAAVINIDIRQDKVGDVASAVSVEGSLATNGVSDIDGFESPLAILNVEEDIGGIHGSQSIEGRVGNLAIVFILAVNVQIETSSGVKGTIVCVEISRIRGSDSNGSSSASTEITVDNGNIAFDVGFICVSDDGDSDTTIRGSHGKIGGVKGARRHRQTSSSTIRQVNVGQSQHIFIVVRGRSVEVDAILAIDERDTSHIGFVE